MRLSAVAAPYVKAVFRGASARWPHLDESDTDRLLRALWWHGVAPMAHFAIRDRTADGVPEAVLSELRDAYLATAARNALWVRERRIIVEALADARVHAVLLKGGAMIGTLYPDAALRPMGDLDVLVAEADMAPAAEALERLGYRRAIQDAEALHHHWSFSRSGPGRLSVLVELHRRLMASPPYDRLLPADVLLDRSREVPGVGRALAAPDALLHLAAHLVLQHPGEERLIWVSDVDRLLRAHGGTPGFWDESVARSRAALLTRSVAEALVLAEMWFAAPVPSAVIECLARPPSGEAAAYGRLRRRAPVGREGARLWADVRGIAGVRSRLAYGVAHAFPPPSYMRRWYGLDHGWQLPVCYGRRILRGVMHVVSDPLRRGRRTAQEPPAAWMVDR